jgi:hypothetical protein
MIVFKHDAEGAFVCGDTETRLTSYAYPTSSYAQQARKAPAATAQEMLRGQRLYGFKHEYEYGARNWRRLES